MKYSSGKKNIYENISNKGLISLGIVASIENISDEPNSDTYKNTKRYNSDEHIIKCRIIGDDVNTISLNKLPNSIPLLPKHLNIIPKIGEMVLIINGFDSNSSDNFYIGPVISDSTKLNGDFFNTTASSMFASSLTTPPVNIKSIPSALGLYEPKSNVVIEGRENTDIIQRNNEVLIRAGKYVNGKPLIFNKTNPGFIQIKYGNLLKDKINGGLTNLTITNVVSDRINLIGYGDGQPNFSNLTSVNMENGVAEYINEDTMQELLNKLHPLPFGDVLIEYLTFFKDAFLNHVHNGSGNKPTDRTDTGTLPLDKFIRISKDLETKMISKVVRIN
jgi:hypothetical protein